MNIQVMSFDQVCDLLEEQRELNDVFSVTSTGSHSVRINKDDCHGYDIALQKFGCRCGISASQFRGLHQALGFLIFSQRGVLEHVK